MTSSVTGHTRRLYGGGVRIATGSPATESKDCITLVRLTGGRDDVGVVPEEVDRTVVELRTLFRTGARSVGVVTPFRSQADALEEAALASFEVDEIEALDLRIGTVHSFQGIEWDIVIGSLGLGPDDSAASWRFVEDPHLLAVFVTRARERLVFLSRLTRRTAGWYGRTWIRPIVLPGHLSLLARWALGLAPSPMSWSSPVSRSSPHVRAAGMPWTSVAHPRTKPRDRVRRPPGRSCCARAKAPRPGAQGMGSDRGLSLAVDRSAGGVGRGGSQCRPADEVRIGPRRAHAVVARRRRVRSDRTKSTRPAPTSPTAPPSMTELSFSPSS
ncbi:MAG: hypothetical protein LC808_36545, partial [Actinobacteria bacterium]|nr:hypothetical protein [Actinomycetota bacterium]